MTDRSTAIRRHAGLLLFAAGTIAVVLSAGLLARHAALFSEKRGRAVEIGSALAATQAAVTLHTAQLDAERAFTRGALTAREEQAEVYVLPETSPVPRMVRAVDQLARILSKAGEDISVVRVSFDGAPVNRGTFKALHGTAVLRGSYQTVARLLGLLSLSGDMMVKDVLPSAVQDTLLSDLESISPLSLRAAYDFLYLDLLAFAADPARAEDSMFAEVPEEVALDLKAFLIEKGTASLRGIFEGIAPAIKSSGIWPLPLVQVDSVVRRDTEWEVGMTVFMR